MPIDTGDRNSRSQSGLNMGNMKCLVEIPIFVGEGSISSVFVDMNMQHSMRL